ncbi:hypothetical protein PDIDSM_5631 [Penicillium digitatum]|nr:hypothetical protein PDIDSM_5631 [Penicillium digitatum]
MACSSLSGPAGSLNAGFAFGIALIYKFGSTKLQKRFLPDLLTGKKRGCVAITEPEAGSDVANFTTTAVESDDDYATLAVRTGGPGAAGLSVLVVPLRGHPGVSMRRLKVSGHIIGGTTYIELDIVKVPVSNIIGKEGDGMRSYVALSAAISYYFKREAFGKTLMDQPVVRHRRSKAGAELESMWTWIEQILYQLVHHSKEDDRQLGSLMALSKAKSAMVLNECVQTAVLLFEGSGFTKSGPGKLVEGMFATVLVDGLNKLASPLAILCDVPGARISGDLEDMLLDLSVRQLVKLYQVEEKKLSQSAKI